MALFRRKKRAEAEASEPAFREDERDIPGSSATLSNIGPQYAGAPEDVEEFDVYTGTSSGSGLRGKPHAGSREDPRF